MNPLLRMQVGHNALGSGQVVRTVPPAGLPISSRSLCLSMRLSMLCFARQLPHGGTSYGCPQLCVRWRLWMRAVLCPHSSTHVSCLLR